MPPVLFNLADIIDGALVDAIALAGQRASAAVAPCGTGVAIRI
jgi:hypothetical protein